MGNNMFIPITGAVLLYLANLKKKTPMSKVTAEMRKGQRTQVSLTIDGNLYKTNYPKLPVIPIDWTYISIKNMAKAIKQKGFAPNMGLNVFALIYNEAAKPDKNTFKGVNNNYAGVQTDSGVWGFNNFIAQAGIKDSGGRYRMFAVFPDVNEFIDFIHNRLLAKGFGSIDTADAYAPKYLTSWVGIAATPSAIASKKSIYLAAKRVWDTTA